MSVVASVFIVIGSFIGVFVTFVGLAVLCDEWLVPHLILLQHKLRMSDDVAGCTLLAFGGAAPEIMISTVAVLGGDVDVGFGIVCGSALIAFGAIPPLCYFSINRPMQIHPWLVIRDSISYVIALALVTTFMFTNGGEIDLYESCGLLVFYLIYILYVVYSPEKPLGEIKDRRRTLSADVSAAAGEQSPLMAGGGHAGDAEGGQAGGGDSVNDLTIVKCFKPFYDPFAMIFNFIFKYTIFPTPEEEIHSPKDAEPYSFPKVLTACLLTFIWLAALSEAIYVLVLLICDNTNFLQPVTVGGIFLAVGAQVPDALAAASMAKQGHVEEAISATLSSQVISITIAFGLPWTIYLAMGNTVDLAQSRTNKISDSSLLCVVVLMTFVFMASTIYSPGVKDHVQIDKKSAIVTLIAFGLSVLAFIVIEILTEIGNDGLL